MPIRPLNWQRDTGKRSKFRRSKVEENRVAGALGGRRAVMSGAARISIHSQETEGADIKIREEGVVNQVQALMGLRLHLEHKRTDKEEMRLQRSWFEKVSSSAQRTAGFPAVGLLFEGGEGMVRDWLGIPVQAFRVWFHPSRWESLGAERVEVRGASVGLRLEWVKQVVAGACDRGRPPAFILSFVGSHAMPLSWVFVPLTMFMSMKEEEEPT